MMFPKVLTEKNATYVQPFWEKPKTVFSEFRTKTYNR